MTRAVHGAVVRGLRRRRPGLDLVRAQEAGLSSTPDPAVLESAATQGRIVLTQDVNTMVGHAYDRVRAGLPMPGLFVLRNGFTIGQLIDGILYVDSLSEQDEWKDQVAYLPL